ncbi:MAG: SMI1/KNR4 family protein [Actinomycetaceae bacterium]|nr:SMI1/KNR4 family protein [Actinomycetaceae bacterium]
MTIYLEESHTQVERIRRKLGVVRLVDYLREASGADSHDYILGDPISLSEVRTFEAEYEVTLPDEYVLFLTEVGNGGKFIKPGHWANGLGAGPGYGIYPFALEQQREETEDFKDLQQMATVGVLSDEEWRSTFAPLDEMDYSADPDTWDALWEKIHYGTLPIAYGGCTDFYGLIINGPSCGVIVDSNGEHTFLDGPPSVVGSDFLSWYESWLDDILLSGVRNSWQRKNFIKSELANHLPLTDNMQAAASSAPLGQHVGEAKRQRLRSLWHWYQAERDDYLREQMLGLLSEFDYERARAEIQGVSDEFLIHILATRAPQHIADWDDRLREMEAIGRQDLIDAAWFLRENADSLAASASATRS